MSAVGKTCPYCQTPVKPGEAVVFCSACSIPHHQQCWTEAEGVLHSVAGDRLLGYR